MLKFYDLEHLALHMLDKADVYECVSVITDKDMAIDIMKEFFMLDEDIRVGILDVDPFDYDREYYVGIFYDEEDKCYEIDVEKAFNYENNVYYSPDGYVLLHKDVNPKAFIDMRDNKYCPIEAHDWFDLVGYNGFCQCEKCAADTPKDTVTKDEAKNDSHVGSKDGDNDEKSSIFAKWKDVDPDEIDAFLDCMEDRIERINDMFNEMEHFKKLLNW